MGHQMLKKSDPDGDDDDSMDNDDGVQQEVKMDGVGISTSNELDC